MTTMTIEYVVSQAGVFQKIQQIGRSQRGCAFLFNGFCSVTIALNQSSKIPDGGRK
jgi:hypothetical protein